MRGKNEGVVWVQEGPWFEAVWEYLESPRQGRMQSLWLLVCDFWGCIEWLGVFFFFFFFHF